MKKVYRVKRPYGSAPYPTEKTSGWVLPAREAGDGLVFKFQFFLMRPDSALHSRPKEDGETFLYV